MPSSAALIMDLKGDMAGWKECLTGQKKGEVSEGRLGVVF